jgi:hypothetical protein
LWQTLIDFSALEVFSIIKGVYGDRKAFIPYIPLSGFLWDTWHSAEVRALETLALSKLLVRFLHQYWWFLSLNAKGLVDNAIVFRTKVGAINKPANSTEKETRKVG